MNVTEVSINDSGDIPGEFQGRKGKFISFFTNQETSFEYHPPKESYH